jgi:hypothetical protein
MSDRGNDGLVPKTLGELLASLGLDDPSMPLDGEALNVRLDAVLGGDAGSAVSVRTEAGTRVRTADEQALVDRVKARQNADGLPRWRIIGKEGSLAVSFRPNHPDAELAEAKTLDALGLSSRAALDALLLHLVDHSANDGHIDEAKVNALLSAIAAIHPRDEVEAGLAQQMVLIHESTVRMAAHLGAADTLPRVDSNANALTKLARIYTQQLETLKRLRSNGTQQVVIKRIEVKDGGQAMVGAIGDVGERSHEGQGTRKRSPRELPAPEDRLELSLPLDETRSPQPITLDMNRSEDEPR